MEAEQSFGKWLRHRRRELDLTQEELARLVGCAPITIRKLEGDEMRPSKQLADEVGRHLGIPLEQRECFVRLARDVTPHFASDFDSLANVAEQPATPAGDRGPSGTLTMLFSNIGRSTKLSQRLGNQFPALLNEYRRILRSSCAKWSGYEVDASGDSFFAVFTGAVQAVAAAADCQCLLAAHPWTQDVQVQVRMGLHTGEPSASTGATSALR
jgi:class 3 adenylate cyclase